MFRKILLFLFVFLAIIQFFRPNKNTSNDNGKDISTIFTVPDSVNNILRKACNDCHSNHTNYPWYAPIQPIAWWLQNHIDEGKHHLNFSEFASYSVKRQVHKLNDLAEIMEEGEMPLNSYTWIHKEARLTKEETNLLINWAKNLSLQINPNQKKDKEHE